MWEISLGENRKMRYKRGYCGSIVLSREKPGVERGTVA
jgi:hypothetical protein